MRLGPAVLGTRSPPQARIQSREDHLTIMPNPAQTPAEVFEPHRRFSPWGHARARPVRGVGGVRPAMPRCLLCRTTHVLLAVSCLLRRGDGTDVIGAALMAKPCGEGHRPIAARLGRPASTARGRLRALAGNAERTRAVLTVQP